MANDVATLITALATLLTAGATLIRACQSHKISKEMQQDLKDLKKLHRAELPKP